MLLAPSTFLPFPLSFLCPELVQPLLGFLSWCLSDPTETVFIFLESRTTVGWCWWEWLKVRRKRLEDMGLETQLWDQGRLLAPFQG